jgi:hypothetical protein
MAVVEEICISRRVRARVEAVFLSSEDCGERTQSPKSHEILLALEILEAEKRQIIP